MQENFIGQGVASVFFINIISILTVINYQFINQYSHFLKGKIFNQLSFVAMSVVLNEQCLPCYPYRGIPILLSDG